MKTKTPKLLETFSLYSKECIGHLEKVVKRAEAEHEDTSFAKYYEAPKYESSDDDDADLVNDASSSDEDEEESKLEPEVGSNAKPGAKPEAPKQKQQSKTKSLNMKEKEALMKQLGKPPMEELPILDSDQVLHLPSSLLSKNEKLSDRFIQSKAYLDLAKHLVDQPVLVILLRSGRYAGAMFRGSKCLHHTVRTFSSIQNNGLFACLLGSSISDPLAL